jgi:hypothetical protein
VDVAHNWGATAEEIARAYPCDGLVVPADEALYRAVSVRASRARVFRWLCQLRAAPYSYDWIDNRGRQSPQELTPGLDDLAVGQRVMSIFELASFERDAHLTLRIRDPGARDLFGDLAATYGAYPDPSSAECARLVVKMTVRYPSSIVGHAMRWFLPWGDLVMMRRQLLNLKALAERNGGALLRQ